MKRFEIILYFVFYRNCEYFFKTRVILPGEKALMVDRFNTKLKMSLTLTNISHKLENL